MNIIPETMLKSAAADVLPLLRDFHGYQQVRKDARGEVRGQRHGGTTKQFKANPGLLVNLIYDRLGAFDGVGGGACQRKVRSGGACMRASEL